MLWLLAFTILIMGVSAIMALIGLIDLMIRRSRKREEPIMNEAEKTETKKTSYYTCSADGCNFGCNKGENSLAQAHITTNAGHRLDENFGKYVHKADGDFVCRDCGSDIMGKTVAHSIHDGPFPLSGSGRCEYELVPYCPKCDKEPVFHGSPITRPSSF